jgi:hypothetical protein
MPVHEKTNSPTAPSSRMTATISSTWAIESIYRVIELVSWQKVIESRSCVRIMVVKLGSFVGDYVTGAGATRGSPPPEGVHVTYPPRSRG